MKSVIILSCLIILISGVCAFGKELLVPSQYTTIQAAVDAAVDGDTVIIAPGTYTGPGNRDISFYGKAITVTSINPNDPCIIASTIIDCNASNKNSHRGFIFNNNETNASILDGITITNGYIGYDCYGSGGAIYCSSSSPTIKNCKLIHNSASAGAGIAFQNSNSIILNCIIQDNSTRQCGGLGGGIFFESSNIQIINSIVALNTCYFNGGGIAGIFGKCQISQCLVYGNHCAQTGGGIYLLESESIINSCTIINNWAHNNGIYGPGGGGGIAIFSANSMISNSILWNNKAYQGKEIYLNGTVFINYSDIKDGSEEIAAIGDGHINWGIGNINEDPRFIQVGNWNDNRTTNYSNDDYFEGNCNFHLLPDSPCINTGDPNYIPESNETDLDGNPRIELCRIDMGAYEFNVINPAIKLSPSYLKFYARRTLPNPEPQFLQIQNCSDKEIYWHITGNCTWLKVSPVFGKLSNGISNIKLSIDINNLPAGLYQTTLNITAYNAVSIPSEVNIFLQIYDLLRVPINFNTIQSAIDEANDFDWVIISDGIYAGDGNRDIDLKGKKIIVRSENGPENCIIDCNGTESEPHRGFFLQNYEICDSIIDGFTVINGYSDFGGAIFCYSGKPIIKNCVFKHNFANIGGALFIAPYIMGYPQYINHCKFSGNCALIGGAFGTSGSLRINNCIISGNKAEESGGAFYTGYSNDIHMNNCTFIGNIAKDNSTIFRDSFDKGLHIKNCIFADYGNLISPIIPIDITYSYVYGGWQGEGNINIDPCFVMPGYWDNNGTLLDVNDDYWVDGDYHLQPDSPCINAGEPNYVPESNETDFDGNQRVMGGRIDIGAYEYSPPIEVNVNITPDVLNLKSQGQWISCIIRLPLEFKAKDVNTKTVLLQGQIKPEWIIAPANGWIVFAKFDRSQIQSIIGNGKVELTITGLLKNGTPFEGSDVINVIGSNNLYKNYSNRNISAGIINSINMKGD